MGNEIYLEYYDFLSKKRFVAITLVSVLITSFLSGCGGGGSSASPISSASAQTNTVQVQQLQWRGDYLSSNSYQAGDLVIYQGSSYMALAAISTSGPFPNPTSRNPWAPLALKGDAGAQGVQGAAGPQGLVGNAGPPGSQGPTGPAGPQGATGAVGPTGPQGQAAAITGFWATARNVTSDINACQNTCTGGGFSAFAAANAAGNVCKDVTGTEHKALLRLSNSSTPWQCGEQDGIWVGQAIAQCWCIAR